jgi:hypothetical protein
MQQGIVLRDPTDGSTVAGSRASSSPLPRVLNPGEGTNVRAIPVNTSSMSVAFIDAVPIEAYDRERNVKLNGQQAADPDGVPLWHVNALCVVEGEDGGETVRIKVASDDKPSFAPLDKVEFDNLLARPWDNNGRSGISFSASGIRSAGASNGRTRPQPVTAGAEGS